MDFLIDASMPRNTSISIRILGHNAFDVRDLGMAAADDSLIAAYAQSHQLCLVSRDFDFADIRNYPPENFFGVIVLDYPNNTTALEIGAHVNSFLRVPGILAQLPGRLAIVEPGRYRLRPAP
jgi:predicted nuclease of predicted toxin-antitoxin system